MKCLCVVSYIISTEHSVIDAAFVLISHMRASQLLASTVLQKYNAGDLGLILGSGRSPEKEMATHSSILAWRIPWAEKHGGLECMASQRVGHNLVADTNPLNHIY